MILVPADYRRDIWPHRNARNNFGGKLSIVRDNPRTRWFKHRDGKGICALHYQNGIRRIKGVLTFPEWRGRGVGTEMTEELLSIALSDPDCTAVEAWTVNPDWYTARGFKVLSCNRYGSTRVQLVVSEGKNGK